MFLLFLGELELADLLSKALAEAHTTPTAHLVKGFLPRKPTLKRFSKRLRKRLLWGLKVARSWQSLPNLGTPITIYSLLHMVGRE